MRGHLLRRPLLAAIVTASALLWWGARDAHALGRPPDPQRAEEHVRALAHSVRVGMLREEDLVRWFTGPPGPLGDGADGALLDQERLMTLFQPDGSLGRVLAMEPEVEAVVLGPDYARVVLATTPYLSLVLVREGGETLISRWETTQCGDCREPVRFVRDLLATIRRGGELVLLPGMDLHLPKELRASDPQQALWRHALLMRNHASGYLRWLLADAEVLGHQMDGVRVAYGERVESWPVTYRDGRWGLDYEGLPPDSLLRLEPSKAGEWRSESYVRSHGREWWLPHREATADGGERWAEHAVGVAWQPVQQRWLLALERPDGLIAGLFVLERDGTVSERRALPHWPDRLAKPVRRWTRTWQMAVDPRGRRLILAGANRWWLVPVDEPGHELGPRGLMGPVTAVCWSRDGEWLALGDDRGNLGLLPRGSARPEIIRYYPPRTDGLRASVAGLAFTPGDGSLVVAWDDGTVRMLGVPSLEELGESHTLCCGRSTALTVLPARGEALLACGGACPPLALTTIPLYGDQPPAQFGDTALAPGGGVLSASPDGRWVVLAAEAPGRSAALCRTSDLTPVAVFSSVPLVQVAWSDDSRAILALREDGSAVHWTLATILERGAFELAD